MLAGDKIISKLWFLPSSASESSQETDRSKVCGYEKCCWNIVKEYISHRTMWDSENIPQVATKESKLLWGLGYGEESDIGNTHFLKLSHPNNVCFLRAGSLLLQYTLLPRIAFGTQ